MDFLTIKNAFYNIFSDCLSTFEKCSFSVARNVSISNNQTQCFDYIRISKQYAGFKEEVINTIYFSEWNCVCFYDFRDKRYQSNKYTFPYRVSNSLDIFEQLLRRNDLSLPPKMLMVMVISKSLENQAVIKMLTASGMYYGEFDKEYIANHHDFIKNRCKLIYLCADYFDTFLNEN